MEIKSVVNRRQRRRRRWRKKFKRKSIICTIHKWIVIFLCVLWLMCRAVDWRRAHFALSLSSLRREWHRANKATTTTAKRKSKLKHKSKFEVKEPTKRWLESTWCGFLTIVAKSIKALFRWYMFMQKWHWTVCAKQPVQFNFLFRCCCIVKWRATQTDWKKTSSKSIRTKKMSIWMEKKSPFTVEMMVQKHLNSDNKSKRKKRTN